MSEYESLREDIEGVADSLARYSSAVGKATGTHDLAIRNIWVDLSELRDELHAVSNRLENLTRAVTTSPAEVAEKMVGQQFVCRVNPGCNEQQRPHVHGEDGALIYVQDEETADRYLAQRRGFVRLAADLKDEPA